MKVLYDHQAFGQIIGGVSRSYVELIKHLNPEIEREVAVKYSQNIYIKSILPRISYPFGNLYLPFKRRLIRKENYKYSIKRLINSNYDLFHSTFDDSYFLPYVRTPFVITVHDLIPEREPQNCSNYWIKSRKLLFERASQIIAVSQNTRNELLHFYPEVKESNITVIHHGYACAKTEKEVGKNEYGNYLLYVGGRDGYKNFNRFVEGITPILIADKELKLVCTGSELTKIEQEFLLKSGILDRVIAKRVDDNMLTTLYKNALLFIFPSLVEGFGIPVLEAWGNGCPVALSNSSCFPEIAGDAAVFFDPTNTDSIKNVINQILENKTLRKELVRRGNERLKLFTWEIAAQKLEMVYRKVIEANK
jgi:glycosyltransferase involved in cell wall biosynthesis